MKPLRPLLGALSTLLPALFGCPGDGSDGPGPVVQIFSTPECRVIAGGFPSGFAPLFGTTRQAAVVQFAPPAVIGLDLEFEPPAPLAASSVLPWPEVASPRCGGMRVDSDLDGRADADLSDELGFRCLPPSPGGLRAVAPDLVALTTSSYEQVVLADPRTGDLRVAALAPPPAGPGFDPAAWPFWPAAGVLPFQSGFSTRACLYGTGWVDSLGDPIGTHSSCDGARDGFVTSFTADVLRVGDRLFAATSNILRSGEARFAPGTLLVFDADFATAPPRIGPHPMRGTILTSGFNPTSLSHYVTPTGRDLVLVANTGALALGTGPGLVRSDSSIDVIDATSLDLIATIPLGRAGLGFTPLAIDPSNRLGLIGAAAGRTLFGIDLAALDDPTLGQGPQTLPIVLDGMTPGFPDARVYDAANAFVLPKRADGPLDADCSTQTSVAIQPEGRFVATSDFCDGTISRLALSLPASRNTPLDPDSILTIDRTTNVVAPLVPSATGEIRAIDRVRVRSGTPGIDFIGPDVHFTAGLPEGAVCGTRIDGI